jgi:hypothetical protein
MVQFRFFHVHNNSTFVEMVCASLLAILAAARGQPAVLITHYSDAQVTTFPPHSRAVTPFSSSHVLT